LGGSYVRGEKPGKDQYNLRPDRSPPVHSRHKNAGSNQLAPIMTVLVLE